MSARPAAKRLTYSIVSPFCAYTYPGTDAMNRVMLPGQQATPNQGLRACWPFDSSGLG